MKRKPDYELAKHFLAQRAAGYSIRYVLKQSGWQYARTIILTILVAGAVACLADSAAKCFVTWALGMLMGALARDFGWLRHIKGHWSFTEKFIDWKKVEELAAQRET